MVFATYIGSSGSTLNPGDNLNLGLGINSMDLTATSDGNIVGFTVNNIQNYNIRNFGSSTSDTTLTFSDGAPGIQSVNLTGSDANGDTVVTGVGTFVTASMANGTGDLTLSYNSSVVTGLSDTQTLTVSNLTGGSFTALGIETLNIVGGAASSTGFEVSGNNNTLNTVNINAAQALGLTVAETTVAAINGAASTGALTLTVDAVLDAGAASITGGSGNDVFIVATHLGSTDVINGGAGTNTLTLTGGLAAANAVGVTNIQVVKAVDVATSADLTPTVDTNAIASATTFQAAQLGKLTTTQYNATVTFSNFADTDTLQVVDGNYIDVSGTAKGSFTTVTSQTDTTTNVLTASIAGLTIAGLTANDAETVNLASNANTLGTVTANTIVAGSFTDATSFVVTGAANLTFTDLAMVASSSGSFSTFNSSAATGKQTVTFSTGGDQIIIGGSANDSISLVAETLDSTDVIDLGGGTNTLTASVDGALGNLNITNVQKLNFSSKASSPAATSFSLGSNTQLTEFNFGVVGSANAITATNIANNSKVALVIGGANQSGEITAAYSTGSSTGIVILGSDSTPRTLSSLKVTGVTTLNLQGGTNAATLSSLVSTNALTTLNISGANVITLAGSSGTSALATINGSTSSGAITIGAGVARTTTAAITGGTGGDNIGLNINTQVGNTIDAGSGTDTLTLTGTSNAAVTFVDLSSTTDQLVSINGTANLAVQKGFENFDASGLTNGFGVSVTASTTTTSIKATQFADVITGAESGTATYVAGAGNDVVTLGGATDSYNFATTLFGTVGTGVAVAASVGTDTVTGFNVASDSFQLSLTVFQTASTTLGTAGSAIAEAQFVSQTGTGAITVTSDALATSGGIIFDSTGDDIYFVQAGVTISSASTTLASLVSSGIAVKIADINDVTLTAADFIIVA